MTRTAQATPPALTAYLRRATWGLPAGRQQEVWDELEEHVLTRADHLTLCGTPYEQALSQALRELGPPGRVGAGMTQVYLMPKVILTAAAAALAASAAMYAFAGGAGGSVTLPILTQGPVKPSCVRGTKPVDTNLTIVSEKGGVTCYTFNDKAAYRGAFIPLSSLSAAVTSQGGTVRKLPENRTELQVPQPEGGFTRWKIRPLFTRSGEGYISAAQVFSFTVGEESGAVLQGFRKPVLQLGNLRLQFGNGTISTVGNDFYNGAALEFVSRVVLHTGANGSYSVSGLTVPMGAPAHTLQTHLPADEAVMLVTRQAGENYEANIAAVGADGTVTLFNSQRKLRFVTDPAQLGPFPSGGRVNALLVRVTDIPLNHLKKGIFLPAQLTSDASN